MQRAKKGYMAGVVTYNPNLSKLKDTIDSILNLSRIDEIVIVDNGSDNIVEVESFVEGERVLIIKNKSNLGIAQALNCIMQRAEDLGYEWVLTCDQDSVVPNNLMDNYLKYIENDDVAIICPLVYDRNSQDMVLNKMTNDIEEVEKCITSGSFNRTSAWSEIGGFDEFMFIDGVDFDYCYRLRTAGFRIVKANKVIIEHEIGNISRKKIGCLDVKVMNHVAFRKYYIVRNRIYTDYKYYKKIRMLSFLYVVKTILLVVLFESEKMEKIEAIKKGFFDGVKCRKV